MNELPTHLANDQLSPLQQEEPAAKTLLLQQHAAYLAKVDRVTFTNRALCLFALLGGGLLRALLNVESACLAYLGVILLAILWRLELSFVHFRLKALEEGIVRKGGGSWEDLYIKSKNVSTEESVEKVILWTEPLWWIVVAIVLLVGNGSSLVVALRNWTQLP